MKPTRNEVAEAAQTCIDDRWMPRVRGVERIAPCDLCQIMVGCTKCPMHDADSGNCSHEYVAWLKADREGTKEDAKQAAQAVVDKLERIVEEYSEVADEAIS